MENKNERILDTLIEIAAEDSLLQEIEEMPSCEELNKIYIPSPGLKKKIHRLITKNEYSARLKKTLYFSGKLATGLLILILITSAILFSVEASRNYIFNIFINRYSNNTAFEFQPNNTTSIFDKYSIKYIPPGFILKTTNTNENTRIYTFANENGIQFTLQEWLGETLNSFIDNEKSNMQVITINKLEAYLFKSKYNGDNNILIWKNDVLICQLTSILDSDQLIQIAEKMEKD